MKRRISRRFQPTLTPGLDQLESRQLLSSGFQVVSSPTVTGSNFSAVSAVSPTDIWAVGSDSTGPLIENFNGTSWSQATAPKYGRGHSTASAPCPATTSGPSVKARLARWSNSSTARPGGPDNADNSGRRRLAQCGDRHLAHRRLGRGQRRLRATSSRTSTARAGASSRPRHQPAKGALSGISAVSSTDIFAVGSVPKGNQLLQFNGTTWSVVNTQITGSDATRAVDAISATDVWVAGNSGIWNFNGTSWTQFADSECLRRTPSRAPRRTMSSPSATAPPADRR